MTHHFHSLQNITFALALSIAGPLLSQQPVSPAAPKSPLSFAVSVTGAGKPMILIPGLDCSGDVWDAVVDHYKSAYQLHVLTIAGFAGEPAIPGLRLSTVRDDLLRYIRDKRLDRPVIVGHSLGGFLAFWVAESAPDVPDRIVSVDGVPFLPALFNPSATADDSKPQAEQMRTMYASMKPDKFAASSRAALAQMITDPKNVDRVAASSARSDAAFTGQVVYDLMTTDLRPDLAKLRAPVLLIGSGNGVAGKPEQLSARQTLYEKQVEAAPRHQVEIAADARHFIMYDDPKFLLRVMDQFLNAR